MFGEVGTEHLQDICIAEVIKEELMVHGSVPKATERGGGMKGPWLWTERNDNVKEWYEAL